MSKKKLQDDTHMIMMYKVKAIPKSQKTLKIKKNSHNFGYINIKKLCSSKDTIE